MKVKYGIEEPWTCCVHDEIYPALVDLTEATQKPDFILCLKKWLHLEIKSMTQLMDWVQVLNCMDSHMEAILNKWRHEIILPETPPTDIPVTPNMTEFEPDMETLKIILSFSEKILHSSINKELYNSAEHLIELLRAYDDELVLLTMRCLEGMAVPPLSHRCDLEITRHTTAIHKSVNLLNPLFEIVESSYIFSDIPVQTFLSDDFLGTLGNSLNKIKVDLNARSKYCKTPVSLEFSEEIKAMEQLLSKRTEFEVDIMNDPRPLKEILESDAGDVSYGLKFSLLYSIRMRRLLRSRQGKTTFLRLQYQATSILLGCHPDSSVLFNFFQDKIDLIKDFIYLLRTGPGALEYDPQLVTLEIRLLACQCLEAILGTRDNSSSPIFVRYPWLMYDLGVNRGQYMGLLPCLIRSATSFLLSVDTGKTVTEGGGGEGCGETDLETRMKWIEHVFMLLIAVVNVTAALPALTDNGMITSLTTVLRRDQLQNRSTTFVFVEVLVVEVLDSAIANHSPALASFREQNGAELTFQRLVLELEQFCGTANAQLLSNGHSSSRSGDVMDVSGGGRSWERVPVENSVLIQEYFSLLSSYTQDTWQDMSGHRNGQLYKSESLTLCFELIFTHPVLMSKNILSPAITLFSEMINHDPAPPSILSHMISNSLVDKALAVMAWEGLEFSSDLLVAVVGTISSVSLTNEGMALIQEKQVFRSLFELFHDPKYLFPQSRTFMHSLPSLIGGSLEELLRHFPPLADQCLDQLQKTITRVIRKGFSMLPSYSRLFPPAEEEEGLEEAAVKTDVLDHEYLLVLHYATSVLSCLEPLLLKKDSVNTLINGGIVDQLMKLQHLALAPSRYILASLSCTIDSTVSSVGFTPLLSLTSRCIAQLSDTEPLIMFRALLSCTAVAMRRLSWSLDNYWQRADFSMMKEIPPALEALRSAGSSSSSPGVVWEDYIGKKVGTLHFHLHHFLDTVDRVPLQSFCDPGPLPPNLTAYATVLQSFTVLDSLIEALTGTIQNRQSNRPCYQCITELQTEEAVEVITALIQEIYVPTQQEMARARGSFVNSTKEECVKAHPVYRLLVTAPEHALVKESFEDTSKKICKVGKGIILEAYERRSSASGMLKYRTTHGWIGTYRNLNSVEPQILVIDVSRKSDQMYVEEVARNQEVYSSPQKRFDFEKFANVSARRGGFLELFHFHFAVKTYLLGSLARNMFNRDYLMVEATTRLNPYSHSILPVVVRSIDLLVPEIRDASFSLGFDAATFVTRMASELNHEAYSFANNNLTLNNENFLRINSELQQKYFVTAQIPSIEEFGTDKVYLAIRITELCLIMLFDSRRNRSEMNILMLLRLWYQDHLFERILHITTLVYMCSLNQFSVSTDFVDRRGFDEFPPQFHQLQDDKLDEGEVGPTPGGEENGDPASLAKYRKMRQVIRERRLLALSTIDSVVEFWKLLLNHLTSSVSMLEKFLHRFSDETHDYDANVFQRHVLVTLLRYLGQVWSHPLFHTLPPTTVKNVLELMGTAIKTAHDWSASAIRFHTPSADGGSREASRQAALANFAGVISRMPAALQGGPGRRPSIRPRSHSQSSATSSVTASESTVRSLEDMGFGRRLVLRAIRDLQTNNVNQLVPYLVENPFLDDTDTSPAYGAAEPTPQAEAGDPTGSQDSADPNETSDSVPPPLPENSGSAVVSTDQDEAKDPPSFAPEVEAPVINPLPEIPKAVDNDLKKEKDFLLRVVPFVYSSVPQICINLIAQGYEVDRMLLLDSDMNANNQSITSEIYTVMVMSMMSKSLDRSSVPESTLRIIQLAWLYDHAINLLEAEPGSVESSKKFTKLFGILHAILILLANKPTSSNRPAESHELQYLVFTLDPKFNILYSLLISTLHTFIRELGFQTLADAEISRIKWIAPAVLILDLMAQPMLMDPGMIRDSFRFLQYLKATSDPSLQHLIKERIFSTELRQQISRHFPGVNVSRHWTLSQDKDDFTTDMSFQGILPDSSEESELVSPPTKKKSESKKGRKSSKKRRASEDPETEEKEVNEGRNDKIPAVDEEEAIKLPLFHKALSVEQKKSCVEVCDRLLYVCSLDNKITGSTIPHAAMQLLTHLTRDEECREHYLRRNDRGAFLFRLEVRFEGYASLMFTLVQQLLEDEAMLAQSMQATIRLCLARLSRQKTSKVSLKNFIEVVSPLIYRNQGLFMKSVKACTRVETLEGQKYIEYLDSVSGDKKPLETPKPKDLERVKEKEDRLKTKRGIITNTPSTKKRKKNDGSASAVHFDPASSKAEATPGVAPGINSTSVGGYENGAVTPSTKVTAHTKQLVEEMLAHVVCKWIRLRSLDSDGMVDASIDQSQLPPNSLTIAELLVILADLISSLPAVALSVHRYQLRDTNVSAPESLSRELLPITHAITGEPLGNNSFVNFLIHKLLLPEIIDKKAAETPVPAPTAENMPAPSVASSTVAFAGKDVRDSCCYFLAALSSRPGEGRKRLLSELLGAVTLNERQGRLEVLDTRGKLQCASSLAQALLKLLHPPPKWSQRDSFILPSKDILSTLVKLDAPQIISNAVCRVWIGHPLGLETTIMLSVPLDLLIRKGMSKSTNSTSGTPGKALVADKTEVKEDVAVAQTPLIQSGSEAAVVVSSSAPQSAGERRGSRGGNRSSGSAMRSAAVGSTPTEVDAPANGGGPRSQDLVDQTNSHLTEVRTPAPLHASEQQHDHLLLSAGLSGSSDEDDQDDDDDDDDDEPLPSGGGRDLDVDHINPRDEDIDQDEDDDDEDDDDEMMEEEEEEDNDDDDDDEDGGPPRHGEFEGASDTGDEHDLHHHHDMHHGHGHHDMDMEDHEMDEAVDASWRNDDDEEGDEHLGPEHDDDDDGEDEDIMEDEGEEDDPGDEESVEMQEEEEDAFIASPASGMHQEGSNRSLRDFFRATQQLHQQQQQQTAVGEVETEAPGLLFTDNALLGTAGDLDDEGSPAEGHEVEEQEEEEEEEEEEDDDEDEAEAGLIRGDFWGMNSSANDATSHPLAATVMSSSRGPGRVRRDRRGRQERMGDITTYEFPTDPGRMIPPGRGRAPAGAVRVRIDGADADQVFNLMFGDRGAGMAGRTGIMSRRLVGATGGGRDEEMMPFMRRQSRHEPFAAEEFENFFQQSISNGGRIDPQTGALTFNFRRRGGFSGASSALNDSNYFSTANVTSEPPQHPLLAVSDPRRSRFLQQSASSATGSSAMFTGRGSHALFAAFVSQIREQTQSQEGHRQLRQVSPRRRALGPIVSDRRWGTDTGEMEAAGNRLPVLLSCVESSLSLENSAAEDRWLSEDGLSPLRSNGTENAAMYQSLFGPRVPFGENSSLRRTMDSRRMMWPGDNRIFGGSMEPEESKEEGVLQETKEGDLDPRPTPATTTTTTRPSDAPTEPAPGSTGSRSGLASTSAGAGGEGDDGDDSDHDDDGDDSDHDDDEPANDHEEPDQQASNNNSDAMNNENSADMDISASDQEPVTTAETPAAETLDPPEAEVSEENVSFVDSLTYDLRQEVMLTADEDFLRSLSAPMRQEAQQLRDQRAMEIQISNFTDAVMAVDTANLGAMLGGQSPTPVSETPAVLGANDTSITNPTVATHIAPETSSTAAEGTPITTVDVPAANSAPLPATGNIESQEVSNPRTPSEQPSGQQPFSSSPPANGSAPAVEEKLMVQDMHTMTLSLEGNRLNPTPFDSFFGARMVRCLLNTNKSKLPRSILKSVATMCRYQQSRGWVLRALFAALFHDGAKVRKCVEALPWRPQAVGKGGQKVFNAAYEEELSLLTASVIEAEKNPLNFRRILCGISFLLRKTNKLVWFDIMSRPTISGAGDKKAPEFWMFGALLDLLSNPRNAIGVNLELLLMVLEEFCSPLSRLSIHQAKRLGASMRSRAASKNLTQGKGSGNNSSGIGNASSAGLPPLVPRSSSSGTTTSSSSSKRRAGDADFVTPGGKKKRSRRSEAQSSAGQLPASQASEATVTEAEEVTQPSLEELLVTDFPSLTGRVVMPFPVLEPEEAQILARIAGHSECGGVARKRLMRIMRNLSLYEGNWRLFLQLLSTVAIDLTKRSIKQFNNLYVTLQDVVRCEEDAAAAMTRPQLSSPEDLSEVRLLNVLRLMTVLRARSSATAAEESDVIAVFIRQIDSTRLWEVLCDCLDIVRDLEGINDMTGEDEEGSQDGTTAMDTGVGGSRGFASPSSRRSSGANSQLAAKREEEKTRSLSALTMRFMPLIEAFLTTCSCTLLKRPRTDGNKAGVTGSSAGVTDGGLGSALKFRLPSYDEGMQGTGYASPAVNVTGVKKNTSSMLPGSRFRQHASYWLMQMELNDAAGAARLLKFTQQNRILLNMVLRNNVQLLENSFSPLICVPRCRQLLHFDIKRAYFKMKMKRIRQTAARAHGGSLRISVRRNRVFEESFQFLRHKTADEMRRRLSVSFHGEEGMDAGGVTREWYSVLARDIFNADYALFSSTGDSVTFQPNPKSYINPDHLSYFKFVGRIIGKAICDGQLLDAHFTRPFYKHILGLPVSVVDLEAIDPEYFKSLKQILDTPLDLLGLDLTFSAETHDFGQMSVIDLIPNGRDIAVTDDSKHEYIKLVAHHRMTTAIRKQIDAFLEGFHDLVPPELISIFDAHELELFISGLPDIDLDDLRAHTDYHGYKPTDPEITYFWNVVRGFSKSEKALFLQFVTGTSKVPLDGFEALQGSDGPKRFNIHRTYGGAHLLPSAHTCFNQLDLPEYPSEEATRDKLLTAVREGSEGFGFA